MTIDEAINDFKKMAENARSDIIDGSDLEPQEKHYNSQLELYVKEKEQISEWLEELKALREYKKRMEMQYLDDIDNPLEPLKLQSALQSEIFKYNYRKEHKPQDINVLDYTVMYALKHCLEEQLKAGENNV